MISIIIPVYNEEKTISGCLESLSVQSYNNLEIIIVDDGSTDKTLEVLSEFQISQPKADPPLAENFKFQIIKQKHKGPGVARNLGAKHARGEILVFADADMTFDKDYIKYLVDPILNGRSKGTFAKDEYVSNWKNVWARCWNYNENIATDRRIPRNYPDESPVFRAILKSEFERVGGFDDIGFTDDWTLSRKLGYKATNANGAICYHKNPQSLKEVYIQSRWIGKNEFISGSLWRQLISIIRFNPLFQMIKGLINSLKHKEVLCLIFQLVYGFGIWISVCKSFVGEDKSK